MNQLHSTSRPGIAFALKRLPGLALLVVLTVTGRPVAYAATGDLDPSFADLGRRVGIAGMEARTVELTDTGGIFVGSNAVSVYRQIDECWVSATSHTSQLDGDGKIDASFASARVNGIQALAFARQPDGRVVGVGRTFWASGGSGRCFLNVLGLAAFRLDPEGSFDTSFGRRGKFNGIEFDNGDQGHSLLLEANGAIVIAGKGYNAGNRALLVFRLTGDGNVDASFGDDGFHFGPVVGFDNEVSLARAASGDYRIAGSGPDGCFVIGLTIDGQPDAAFGTDGIAWVVGGQGERVTCNALESTADGGLLVAGIARKHGFVAKLLADGSADPSFVADAMIAGSLTTATAITPGSNGNVYVAGVGPKGTSILRLNAAGALDATFGDGGRTWIDLQAPRDPKQPVNDMALHTDGSLLVAGDGPFVAKLLGDAGGESAGVISVLPGGVRAREADGRAIVHVRRSGGGDGDVSVDYRTVNGEAVAGEDFTAKEGTLHWADHDRSLRTIVLQIADNSGRPEGTERFNVRLENVQGGAGLGSAASGVSIQPDGEPGGQLQFAPFYDSSIHRTVNEDDDFVQVILGRDFFAVGRVCVTAATRSGTAIAAEDFTATESVQCWEDGESGIKIVEIPILPDDLREEEEHFTVVLSHATGGAIVGAQRVARVTIKEND